MNVIVDSLSIYHRIHMNTDIEAAVYLCYVQVILLNMRTDVGARTVYKYRKIIPNVIKNNRRNWKGM